MPWVYANNQLFPRMSFSAENTMCSQNPVQTNKLWERSNNTSSFKNSAFETPVKASFCYSTMAVVSPKDPWNILNSCSFRDFAQKELGWLLSWSSLCPLPSALSFCCGSVVNIQEIISNAFENRCVGSEYTVHFKYTVLLFLHAHRIFWVDVSDAVRNNSS